MKKLLLILLFATAATAQEINIYPNGFYACDENGAYDGFSEFDLSVKTTEILAGQNPNLYNIAYYDSEQNAQNNTNPLPLLYTNTVSMEQRLYVKATKLADNSSTMINLFLYVGETPIAHQAPNLTEYYPSGGLSIVRFNLLSQDAYILGDQNPWTHQINYYTSLEDAESGNAQNSITHCYYATGTTTIWVAIWSQGTACIDITSFTCTAIAGSNPNPSPIITFTDPNLKTKLLESAAGNFMAFDYCFGGNAGESVAIDRNHDGEIQQDEADAIYILFLSGGNISSLGGIEHFKNLDTFRCNNNNLTAVPELAQLHRLMTVNLDNNHLTSLDFSVNPLFDTLSCYGNNLISINMKNGRSSLFQSWNVQNWGNNPNLAYVCVDDDETDRIQQTLLHHGYTNVELNSYCTSAPVGDYNTITGTAIFDNDGNGCDASDLTQPFIKIKINDGNTTGSTFTTMDGHYQFLLQYPWYYTITPQIENPLLFSVSPTEINLHFSTINNITETHNFCISPIGFHPDLEVIIAPLTNARPGFDARYLITFKNKGNYTYSEGIVGLQFNDAFLDFISASQNPMLQTAGQLQWSFTNLHPFESRGIIVTFNVNGPTEVPPVNSGDHLNFTVSSFPSEVDETPLDNTFAYHQMVVGSFDPNDKTCLEGNIIAPEVIGNYLHYSINFENTGTAAAERIVVKDIIDTTKFDISTLQVLNTSHPVATKMTGNKVEFMFDNINLAPAAHGNVVFKIKTKSNLSIGTTVSNKAEIYFDYNFPVETNTATSTFQLLNTTAFEVDNSVTIYPNPARDTIAVNADSAIKTIQLFDVQGRIMHSSLVDDTKSNLDITSYSRGIYFVKATTAKGTKIQKIIKE